MFQEPYLDETAGRLHYLGNSIAISTTEQSGEFGFEETDTVVHFGLKVADVIGDWPEQVHNNYDGALPDKQLPIQADDKLEWQETMISHSNRFACGSKRHMVVLCTDEPWMMRQAGITVFVALLEAGLPVKDSLEHMGRLNPQVSAALTDADMQAAISIQGRAYHLT